MSPREKEKKRAQRKAKNALIRQKKEYEKSQNQKIFMEAKLDKKITTHFGSAIDIIPHIGIQFDLIFIDADKINYGKYFEMSMEKLRLGGFILADNVLWSGKVFESTTPEDEHTKGIIEFNEFIKTDDRIEKVILPLRDGLTLIRKK